MIADADKNFFNKIIMEDETWCLWPRNKATWVLNGWVRHPIGQKKLKFHRFSIKNMLIIFFDSQGIVHKEFVPEGKTVNTEFYKGVMDRLLKCIQGVRPAAFCSRDLFLLHDNAPTHKAARVCQFFTPKNVTTLYHLLYSPDLSLSDYFLFPKLKMKLRGLHFADVAEIQEAVTDELKKVQKKRNFWQLFRNCTSKE